VEDDVFFDDVLASFTQAWGQAQNWGAGAQSGSVRDSNITYTLSYTITCARQPGMSAVSQAALLAYGQAKAKRRKVEGVSETTLVGWSIDRLRRGGFALAHASDREFHFRAVGNLANLVERRFGGQSHASQKATAAG